MPDAWERALADFALQGIPVYHIKHLREVNHRAGGIRAPFRKQFWLFVAGFRIYDTKACYRLVVGDS